MHEIERDGAPIEEDGDGREQEGGLPAHDLQQKGPNERGRAVKPAP